MIHSGNDRPDGRSSLPAGVSTSFPARFTLLLSLVETQVHAAWLLLLIAGCELTGDFTLLMILLKSGLFSPQRAPAYPYEA